MLIPEQRLPSFSGRDAMPRTWKNQGHREIKSLGINPEAQMAINCEWVRFVF